MFEAYEKIFKLLIRRLLILKIYKICSTEYKEDLKHLYEHFDKIETIQDDLSKYKDQTKIVE